MITIRKSTPADAEFIAAHAYRLVEFGPPKWRDPQVMTAADIKYNTAAVLSTDPDIETFIAIDAAGEACGFIYLTIQTDYYTQERHAHITDIVVTKKAEGKGVGKLLLQKADEWARQKKLRWVTLNVLEGNTHAQAVYEKTGFQKEWIKYLKQLD
jgi:ribosomal protein S18 acetylase RimI-like enzyme